MKTYKSSSVEFEMLKSKQIKWQMCQLYKLKIKSQLIYMIKRIYIIARNCKLSKQVTGEE